MNLIAIDIGNTNLNIGLYLKGEEKSIESIPGKSKVKLKDTLKSVWEQIPIAKASKEKKRDGVIIVSSVKPTWTKLVQKIAKQTLDEKIQIIGQDIPLPIDMLIDEPEKVGTDRVIACAAAYAVVEDAVVVIDCGTAITVDFVDEKGTFQGGAIYPGLQISAQALKNNTAQLPNIKIKKPTHPYGKNTTDAIMCGIYYSTVDSIEGFLRRYAEKIGRWPQSVITGSDAKLIKDDCTFIDSYVPYLVVKGIALTYREYIDKKQ